MIGVKTEKLGKALLSEVEVNELGGTLALAKAEALNDVLNETLAKAEVEIRGVQMFDVETKKPGDTLVDKVAEEEVE